MNTAPTTAERMTEAANVIVQGAYETLASVHGCTVGQVRLGLDARHPKLCEQFVAIIDAATTMAVQLHTAGRISLVG